MGDVKVLRPDSAYINPAMYHEVLSLTDEYVVAVIATSKDQLQVALAREVIKLRHNGAVLYVDGAIGNPDNPQEVKE